ncbi:MAG: hypothetical protein HOO91_14625 [Bacteroidales bacterium]|nr:hypothetical protein [Bacteroidales bacterium]
MITKIYISRKLESLVSKSAIKAEDKVHDNPLGKWNATIFYVSHKKCLMITNNNAIYTVILDRIKTSDFSDLSKIFAETLFEQLLADDIKIDKSILLSMIGKVELFETDNDKSVIGIQNSVLPYVEDWKYEFGHIDNWPFREINRRINEIPYKQIEWLLPKEKMKLELNLKSV